jgi:hypothetical protein
MNNGSLKCIKNNLSEHFDNFAVVAIDRKGNLIWEYSNWMVALMLLKRAKDLIKESAEDVEVVWDDEDDDDDDGWGEESLLKV